MVFLRKILILFKLEMLLSESAVVMDVVRRIRLSECAMKVVLREKLEQSQCTTASPELVVLIDEG